MIQNKIWHGERLLQTYFKALYDADFLTHRRPFWLKTSDNKQLEFDGYNPELHIAFEHNGNTHYEYTPYFHDTEDDFRRQQANDRRKKYLCKKQGVHLIIVPQLYTKHSPITLPLLIEKIYEKKQLRLPPNYHKVVIKSDGSVWRQKRILWLKRWELIR